MTNKAAYNNITPIKLGIKFTPPSLLLIYNDKSKLRSRTIPVKELDILTDLPLFTKKFKSNEKHRKYLEKISSAKLEKQFFILQDYMKGYTLTESLERAKKYENGKKSDLDESKSDDLNDFKDTEDEDEDEKNTKSPATAKKEINTETKTTTSGATISKSTALDLLSTQMKSLKSSMFDFEEEVDDEDVNKSGDENEHDDDILNFGGNKGGANKAEQKLELPKHDDSSDSSF